MKKVLITGGAGTIGKAFIKRYQDRFKFYNMSRDEGSQTQLKREFPEVKKVLNQKLDGMEKLTFQDYYNLHQLWKLL